jgi:hypothetical protein
MKGVHLPCLHGPGPASRRRPDDAGHNGWVRSPWEVLRPYSVGGNYVIAPQRGRRGGADARGLPRRLSAPGPREGRMRPGQLLQRQPQRLARAMSSRSSNFWQLPAATATKNKAPQLPGCAVRSTAESSFVVRSNPKDLSQASVTGRAQLRRPTPPGDAEATSSRWTTAFEQALG